MYLMSLRMEREGVEGGSIYLKGKITFDFSE